MSFLTERSDNKKRTASLAALILFFLALAVVVVFFIRKNKNNDDYAWVEDTRYIAHALGGIEGNSYTNCREALEASYEKGYRVIEADVEYTSDGELVLLHNWKKKTLKELLGYETEEDELVLSYEEFMGQKICGKYTPMSFKDLMDFMKDHPDMLLVLDGKYDGAEDVRRQYGDIVKTAKECDEGLPERMIPQIYNEDMYDVIKEAYDWKSVIFTWYKLNEDTLDPGEIFDFCDSKGIRVCTMEDSKENPLLDREADRHGIYIYVHTINDEGTYKRLLDSGVKGVYTDFLSD